MHFKNKFLISFLLLLALTSTVKALSPSELQALIDQKKQEKAQLDEENKKLTEQINNTEAQAQSLSSTVKVLDQTAKKLGNDIKSTKTTISKTQYEIQQLSQKIQDAESRMTASEQAVVKSLQSLSEADRISVFEQFLAGKTMAEAWNDLETLGQFNESLRNHINALDEAKTEYTSKKEDTSKKKNELVGLQTNLTVQQKIILENQAAKTKVLVETKNLESAYQKQLQANLERGRQIEQDQFDYESQLQIAIDPSKLPTQRAGVFSWPISPVKITQKFGKTVSSKVLYVSGTHNGVDFRATVGTPVRAVLSGTIQAMGNTDDQRGCYSYGRWVLIRHNNGLTSIYGHLSGAVVSVGQTVETGQTIGFSGGQPGAYGSGYSTGPHLHLGLFATEGVRVQLYTASKFCKNVSIPIAPLNGYLDPLAYLPTY